MKKAISSKGQSIFYIVLIAIGLIILFGCIFGFFCWKTSQKEKFLNGCSSYQNFDDPNFKNERYFHYDNIGNLISSDPINVNTEVVDDVMYESGSAKKKSQ